MQHRLEPVITVLTDNTRPIMRGAAFALVLLLIFYVKIIPKKYKSTERPATPDLEKRAPKKATSVKASERKLGEWKPVDFKRPEATPLSDWDVHKTEPLPYRPFRYGSYHMTMGLRNMNWDEWIELDNHYLKFHAIRTQRIEERGDKCCRTAPEAMDAAIELLEEFCDYLPQRYPTMFRKTAVGMDNIVTGESFDIVQRPLAEDPMATAGRMVQDDLAIMFEKPDGQYYLLAGAILLAGFWRLGDKFGMSLSEIHTSGEVPEYKPKLEKGSMNFFRRIQPQNPVLRNNYFIQLDDDIAWSSSLGPEDDSTHTQSAGWSLAEKTLAVDHHYFRSERQSLRRLPRSGGVAFTIRTYFEPITKIAQEVGVPGRLASAIRSWGPEMVRYKGRDKFEDVLLEYLDGQHRQQVQEGLTPEEECEDERKAYPF